MYNEEVGNTITVSNIARIRAKREVQLRTRNMPQNLSACEPATKERLRSRCSGDEVRLEDT